MSTQAYTGLVAKKNLKLGVLSCEGQALVYNTVWGNLCCEICQQLDPPLTVDVASDNAVQYSLGKSLLRNLPTIGPTTHG